MIWLAVLLTLAYLALDGTVLHTSRTVRRAYWAATSAVVGFWLSSLSNMDASWLVLSAVRVCRGWEGREGVGGRESGSADTHTCAGTRGPPHLTRPGQRRGHGALLGFVQRAGAEDAPPASLSISLSLTHTHTHQLSCAR